MREASDRLCLMQMAAAWRSLADFEATREMSPVRHGAGDVINDREADGVNRTGRLFL